MSSLVTLQVNPSPDTGRQQASRQRIHNLLWSVLMTTRINRSVVCGSWSGVAAFIDTYTCIRKYAVLNKSVSAQIAFVLIEARKKQVQVSRLIFSTFKSAQLLLLPAVAYLS